MIAQKRVKVKPKHLEEADRLAVLMDAKLTFQTCRLLRAAPASYGGESTEAVLTNTLSWLPRTSSLPELEIKSKDRQGRQVASRLSQGDFIFTSSDSPGDGIQVFVDRAPVLRLVVSPSSSDFSLEYEPSFGRKIQIQDRERLG
jgi:hypothetical protein